MIKGFVCGAFDLIHPGYILLLKDAKGVCQHLTVGLHIDPSLENPDKVAPIHTASERELMLRAIKYVDDVVIYRTETGLANLLNSLKPDIRILGSDYRDRPITAKDVAPIYWHERNHDYSYTSLRQRIAEVELNRMENNEYPDD